MTNLKKQQPLPVPPDFAANVPLMTIAQLARQHGVSPSKVAKWKRVIGAERKPTTFRAAAPVAPPRPSKETIKEAELAADYLRAERIVSRRNAAGEYDPTGHHWLCGREFLTAVGVIELARRRGFRC